ncbi:MAG TPA: hypothetical protein VFM34_09405 [Moraxellaceae bacterium]|nr:hypothetical protein [Moraxellaceae bacterium]
MKTCTGIAVVLMTLSAMAMADTDEEMARCTSAAQKFATSPGQLSIGELDALKSCINSQRATMLTDAQQQKFQSGNEHRLARASLRDDF